MPAKAKLVYLTPALQDMEEIVKFYLTQVGAASSRKVYNDYMMAKSQKAFRRAASRRSKTAWLFCHILIAMSIGRMILGIIRCQTCRLAAKSIETSIDFAIR